MKPSIVMDVDPENKEETLSIKNSDLHISFINYCNRMLLLLLWKGDKTKY